MKKRMLCLILSVLLAGSLLAGCGASGGSAEAPAPKEETAEAPAKDDAEPAAEEAAEPAAEEGGDELEPCTIFWLNNSTSDESNKLTEDFIAGFEERHPGVHVEWQSGGSDYYAVLATKINSGEIPDIFITDAVTDKYTYLDYEYDLSTDPDFMDIIDNDMFPSLRVVAETDDGQMTGLPGGVTQTGWIYNKDLFEQAGITELPKTLSQWEDACEKLVAIGVTPFAMPYKEWWIIRHQCACYIAESFDNDMEKMVEDLNSGAVKFKDLKYMDAMFDMLDLTVKYGIPKQLEYDVGSAAALLVDGTAAVQQQGTWEWYEYTAVNPDANLGILGWPIGEEADRCKIDSGGSGKTCIYRNTEHYEAAKAFVLEYWDHNTHTKEGVENGGGGGFKSCATEYITNKIDLEASALSADGGSRAPAWVFMPFEFQQEFGTILQEYIGGQATREQILDELQQAWDKFKE